MDMSPGVTDCQQIPGKYGYGHRYTKLYLYSLLHLTPTNTELLGQVLQSSFGISHD